MKRNMTIKKVAGFHSFDFLPLIPLRLSLRRGLGIKEVQNPVSTMVAGLVLDHRMARFLCAGVLDASSNRLRPINRSGTR